jgi:hypothetical protein
VYSSVQEKDVGVTGNPIALTITWSFAMFPDSQAPIRRSKLLVLDDRLRDLGQVHPNAPALGQMEEPGAQGLKGLGIFFP